MDRKSKILIEKICGTKKKQRKTTHKIHRQSEILSLQFMTRKDSPNNELTRRTDDREDYLQQTWHMMMMMMMMMMMKTMMMMMMIMISTLACLRGLPHLLNGAGVFN